MGYEWAIITLLPVYNHIVPFIPTIYLKKTPMIINNIVTYIQKIP